MKTSMKRFISLLVVTALLLSSLPMAFANAAASFTDFPTGWSAPAMAKAVENGLLAGFEDGTIRPEDNLTRAEVATIITRAFGAQTTADISAFTDVPADAWFYPYIARAVKMGALQGTSATTMAPDISISREQVFTAVARVLVLSSENTSVLNKFNDAGSISSWAVPYMAALVERGYVNGDTLGNVNPQANITREEFAQFMYNAIRTYITQPGTYNADLEGITVLRVGDVTLENLNATSDIVLGDGVGTGAVKMTKVAIEKRLLARGGTVTLSGTTAGDGVVVNNVNGNTHFNNYRTEAVFTGIVENTTATFLTPPGTGGATGGSGSSGGGGGGDDDDDNTYSLLFYLKASNLMYDYKLENITPDSSVGSSLPVPAAADIIGYRFLGWFKKDDNTVQVTGTTPITGNWELVAKLERINYPVSFKNEDGTTDFSYFDNYTPAATANVAVSYTLPTAANIKRTGYTFDYWTDLSGNRVNAITITATTPETGFVLKPVFTKNTYNVEFYYADSTAAQFVSGYTAPTQYAIDILPALPGVNDVVAPQGEYFDYWVDENGTRVDSLTVTDDMQNGATLKLYAHTSTVPPSTYDLTFYLKSGDATPYATISDVVENTQLGSQLPTPAAEDIIGYRFLGWFDGTTQVTATTPVNGNWNLVAKLELIEYPVSFKNEDGTTTFSYFDNYTPAATANVTVPYTLPTAANIKRTGYTFNGWKDASGNPVTTITITETTSETGFVLIANFTKHIYNVEFYYADSTAAQFVSGYTVPTQYAIDNLPALPGVNDVVPPQGEYFDYWEDENGTRVDSLTVTDDMQNGATLKLYAKTGLVPPTTYDLNFYLKSGDTTPYATISDVVENTQLGSRLPTPAAADIIGYRFLGWFDGTTQVTATTPVNGNWNLVAKLELIEYPVSFKNEDGTTTFSYFDNYTPAATANVAVSYTLPTAANIKRTGYTFDYWTDLSGNRVDAITITATTPETGFVLKPVFTKHIYNVEFYYADSTAAQFVSGYTAPTQYAIDNLPALPGVNDVVPPQGEYFDYWEDENGTRVDSLTVTDDMQNGATLKLYAKTGLVPPTTYDLNFYLKSGDTTPYATISDVVENTQLGSQLPTPAAADILGYRFLGWFDGATQVTATTPVNGNWNLVAKLELIDYPVSFKNEDGTTTFSYFDNYTPAATVNVGAPYVMPSGDNIKRTGYTFNGWKDASGNPVSAITITETTPETGFVLIANFTKNIYNVEFYYADSTVAQFVSGYTAPTQYAIDNLPALPGVNDVVAPQGEYFDYWEDENGTRVDSLTVTDDMQNGATLKLYAKTGLVPPTTYDLNFYLKSGDTTPYATISDVVENTQLGSQLPTPAAADILGYRFLGWFNGTTQVTATTPVNGNWNLVAKLELIEYPVSFKNEDGTTTFSYFDNYTPAATANVTVPYTLPTDANIKRTGYTFNGWKDASGNPVTTITITETTSETGFVLIADFTKHIYNVEFYYADSTVAQFVSGYTAPSAYSVDNLPALPGANDVVPPQGHYFLYWQTEAGTPVYALTVSDGMSDGDTLKLYAKTDLVQPTTYSLNFYLKSGDAAPYATISNVVENTALGTSLPTPSASAIAGYRFLGWFDGTTQVTATTPVTGNWDLVAKLELIEYPVVFKNEDGTTEFSYFTNYIPAAMVTAENPYVMPTEANINRPGYTFDGWTDATGNPITTITITENTPETGFVLKASFSFTVTFKLYENDTTAYTIVRKIPLTGGTIGSKLSKMPALSEDEIAAGYTFDGWFKDGWAEGKVAYTLNTPITENTTLIAHLDLIEYPLAFEHSEDPSQDLDEWIDVPLKDVITIVDGYYILPVQKTASTAGVNRPGYTFLGWKLAPQSSTFSLRSFALMNAAYEEGEQSNGLYFENGYVTKVKVTDETPLAGFKFVPEFSKDTYYVEFYNADGTPATFVPEYTAPTQYDIDTLPALPSESQVIVEGGELFENWVNASGNPVYRLTVTGDMQDGDILKLYVHTKSAPADPYTVSFYEGYGTQSEWMKDVSVEKNDTVAEADIPAVGPRKVSGYKENGSVASVYEGNEYTHVTIPTYWYEVYTFVCADCNHSHTSTHVPDACANCAAASDRLAVSGKAKLKLFDETVPVLGDLKVYLLYQRLGLYLNYDETDLALAITAAYEDDTRLMDTLKDLAVSAGNQLNTAIMLDQIPNYGKVTDELKARLEAAGLIDADKNIQILELPISIFDVFNEDTAADVFEDHRFEAYYQPYIDSMREDETFEINTVNLVMIEDVLNGIRNLSYDDVLAGTENKTIKKVASILGNAFLEEYYNDMNDRYCDGLEEAIANVERTGLAETYSTSALMRVDPMQLLTKLYEKAQEELVERLQSVGVRYDENIYLKYLVEHDVVAALFNGDTTLASGESTGYQLKSTMDYYNYLVSLLIVADDALCWYGDSTNVTEEELDAVYDAVFGKIYTAHSKLNEILETYESEGKLPARVENLIGQVKQINSVLTRFDSQIKSAINKYLNSSVNDKIEDGTIHENEKVQRVVDLLIGTEDPIFNVDALYALLYRFDDNAQEQLQKLIDSGKLQAAIEKFEATDFGKLFNGKGKLGTVADKLEEIQNTGKVQTAFNSIYDFLVVLAKEGIEPYRIEQDEVTVMDSYQVTIGGIVLKVKRYYQ